MEHRALNANRPAAFLIALIVLLLAAPGRADTTLKLREGTAISISANRAGDQLALELAGRIWLLDPATGETRAITPSHQLSSHPALSPDGKQVAYEVFDLGRHQIFIADTSGDNARRITFGDYDNHAPAWHPDGQRLLLVSNRGGSFDLWELDTGSLNLMQLTFTRDDERDPAWNRTGTRLAFVVDEPNGGSSLYVMEPDGRSAPVIAEGNRMFAPAWRADDALIAYVSRAAMSSQLRVAILSEPVVSKGLTNGENVFPSPSVWLNRTTLLYAADGRIKRRDMNRFSSVELPFEAAVTLPGGPPRTSSPRLDFPERYVPLGITGLAADDTHIIISALGDLWELDRNGQVTRQLTNDPALDTQPALSPSGDRLAFISDRSGSPQVWIMDLQTGLREVISAETGIASHPAWRSDGAAVAFLVAKEPGSTRRDVIATALDAASRRLVAEDVSAPGPPAFEPRGNIVVSVPTRAGHVENLVLAASEHSLVAAAVPGTARQPRWSADGAWLLVDENDYGALAVLDRADHTDEPSLRVDGASLARWSVTANELVYLGPDGIHFANPQSGATSAAIQPALTWSEPPQEERIVIRAGRVFDGLAPSYRTDVDIVVDGRRIVSIEPQRRQPPRGQIIDASDLVVLPGLIDLSTQGAWPPVATEGRAWLAAGITTIRQFGVEQRELAERQESWASGRRLGPRLVMGGSLCNGRSLTDPPPAALAAIETCGFANGLDQRAQIELVHGLERTAVSATPFPALWLGVDEIQLNGELAGGDRYRQQQRLLIYGDVIDLVGARGLTTVSRLGALSPAIRRGTSQALFRAVSRGARVVVGSATITNPPGSGTHREMRLLTETGLQPFEVLRMATRDAAAAIGAAGELGEVRPGYRADLVLVNGDPLQDIHSAAKVVVTMVNGRVYRQPDLVDSNSVGKIYNPGAD